VRRIHEIPPADLCAVIEILTCNFDEHADKFDNEAGIDEGE